MNAAKAIIAKLKVETRPSRRQMLLRDYAWKVRTIDKPSATSLNSELIDSFIPHGFRHTLAQNSSVEIDARRFDVSLLTTTTIEHPMMLRALGLPEEMEPDEIKDDKRYWHAKVFSHQSNRELQVVVTNVGRPRNLPCSSAVASLRAHFNVDCCILTGIAAGIQGKTKLGDVVVGMRIIDYEGGRLEPNSFARRPEIYSLQRPIRTDVEAYGAKQREFEAHFRGLMLALPRRFYPDESLTPDFTPTVIKGFFANGEKLIVDGSLVVFRGDYDERIRAGEMESLGLAEACVEQGREIPWLVVKGISDYGEKRESANSGSSEVDKGNDWQSVAALAASSVVIDFLKTVFRPTAVGSNWGETP